MANLRPLDLDDLINRPGTYFNPQTEILIVVDDSPEIDGEIFNEDDFEGADWVQISDEVPVDERQRDELLERFQVQFQPNEIAEDDPEDEEDDLEPDDEDADQD
jgi:hypothetical protein